jgi:hypothetical protein
LGLAIAGGGGHSAAFFQSKTVPKLYQENGILGIFALL